MARAAKTKKKPTKKKAKFTRPRPIRFLMRWVLRGVLAVAAFAVVMTLLFAVLNPPTSVYMLQERIRLGPLERDWVRMEDIAPVMARSAVAAEDANFCLHWGLDIRAIEAALDAGGTRGASTISQQVVKNVFLWHGRSWVRKAVEAFWTPLTELIWTKRRILEVYLNVAEFDEGVFGVQAAALQYFGVTAAELTAVQAARLAAVLPDPKGRDAANPTGYLRKRAASILDGAATIAADGRAACFSD
ncbi:MAG: monofunctional biosynthetic peptidoglycan transglycosylase [Yoonia sp.]